MYDLIVLGGGPGGYLAAERAGAAGLSVLLAEKRNLGGVCLNEGCIPSKTFLNSAKIYEHAVHGEKYGVTTQNAELHQKTVVTRKNKVVKKLVAGVGYTLKNSGAEVIKEAGKIIGREKGILQVQIGEQRFEAKNLILASGSEAVMPPIPGVKEGLESGTVLTNREILDLTEIPETLTVIGGGVIGLEMAGYFQTAGSKVTVVEMLDHIAGAADTELTEILQKSFEKKGILFYLSSKVVKIGGDTITFADADDKEVTIASEKTLLCVGRRPVIENIGLESIGVYTEKGRIVTDERGLTNVPGVYAVGDVNGVYMLAHAAYREAEVAVNTILGIKDRMRYDAVPSVLYTNPEMAFVGMTEDTCNREGIPYEKRVLPMAYSGRYMAENEDTDGMVKILIDPVRERLLGCHIIGSYASEIILTAGVFIESQLRIKDIKEIIFPHPTVGEIIREAVFSHKK